VVSSEARSAVCHPYRLRVAGLRHRSQAGYAIQSNTIGSTGSISGSEIQFTGHGIKGQIGAASGLGLGTLTGGSDVIGITLNPQ